MLEVYTSRFRVQRQIWHIWEWVSPWPIPIWPGVGAVAAVFVQLQFGLLKLWTDILPFPLNLAVVFGIAAARLQAAEPADGRGPPPACLASDAVLLLAP